MSLEKAAARLRDCAHGAAITYEGGVKRCPHCGGMYAPTMGWARPHLVAEMVRAIHTPEQGAHD